METSRTRHGAAPRCRRTAAPPPNAAAGADEAADLARGSAGKNTSVWDEMLKAARGGLVRLVTS